MPLYAEVTNLAGVETEVPFRKGQAKGQKRLGSVRRRTDQVARAEPPPANPSSASQNPHQGLPLRSKKPRKCLGNDSGSDSDSDNNGRRAHNRDGSGAVAKLRRPTAPESPKSSGSTRTPYDEEEERKRTRELRLLRAVEEKWPDMKYRKEKCESDGLPRRRTLISYHEMDQAAKQKELLDSLRHVRDQERKEALQRFEDENTDPFWYADMRSFVSRLDQQRRDFLDEALFRNIGDHLGAMTGGISTFSSQCLRETVERIEMGFLRRCRHFDQDWSLRADTPPPNLQTHVVNVIKRMSEEQWDYVYGSAPGWARAFKVSLESENSPLRSHIRPSPKGVDSALAANVLVDNYIGKVVDLLSSASDFSFKAQSKMTFLRVDW
ncbi:hypothetical protein QBC34DRAFT_466029 [Podospora aff. communis PSN243]|uniref:Uncharacterized protein n=1 Tax=Podospora aff. communis PSN243 TaxID=3040156 RepID=A0AAV9GJ03_9PEZI|nr:hypothetical protein QBC34DRAFT_466029 [Podospora aff. communis PSN243]